MGEQFTWPPSPDGAVATKKSCCAAIQPVSLSSISSKTLPIHSPLSRSVGNRMTSRIDRTPLSAMSSRSMPIPTPTVGGIPYSSAST